MRIILAGIIGRYPWGGVTWCSLMYLLGLRKLGHEVFYLEDTCECNYDPLLNTVSTDPSYALNYINRSLKPFDLDTHWCYVDYKGNHHGISFEKWKEICASTDLFLVLSGGCWIWRDHYARIPVKAFIDSDPAFTQLAIHNALKTYSSDEKKKWYVDFFKKYDVLFTIGRNIGTSRCSVPTGDFTWYHTWQPICMDIWTPPSGNLPARREWTTVMTWSIKSFTDIGGNKDQEFLKVLDLARRCKESGGANLELAINGPKEFLSEHGWNCVDAFAVSADLWRYHHYLTYSRGEFSVAKHTYVETNCGWFSDRTACYLASGRPAVIQDTGFTGEIPVGSGLIIWQTGDEAYEALKQVESDYSVHSKHARTIAHEHFEDRLVLTKLLERCS